MHAGSAPVIRLKGPLALGHAVLLAVSIIPIRLLVLLHIVNQGWSDFYPARSPPLDPVRSRIADFWATV